MFNYEEYQLLSESYDEFATEQLKLKPSTQARYKIILDDYFKNYIINKVEMNDYATIFDTNKLLLLKRRKSNNVRPSLMNFLEFLKNEEFLDEYLYYRLQNNVKEVFATEEIEKDNEIDFLTSTQIRKIFSNQITYKYKYEEKILPLLSALSFYCMFKQEDVIRLKLTDLDLDNKRIRNVRHLDNPDLVEWLNIDEVVLSYLKSFLEFRESQDYQGEELIFLNNGPLDNSKINTLFNCYERRDNSILLERKGIYQNLLIRSMMFFILKTTQGSGFYKLLLEQEINKQLEYAFNEYLSIYRTQHNGEPSEQYSINEILPIRKKTKAKGAYSEDNDLTEQDIKDYDMENNKNLQEHKVAIQRLVRDSNISRQLKELYNNECQLCGYKLRKSNGEFTSEAHHIQPYNKKHRGDDSSRNIIVLCPNCHTQFDDLYFAINPITKEVHCIFTDEEYHLASLNMKDQHSLGEQYLEYTWNLFEQKRNLMVNDLAQ